MAVTTANQVANYILTFSQESGDCFTNLKLQKLLYYAQAWYLALYDEPLFDDEIEAWVHGPVVRSVYNEFKKFEAQPISIKVSKSNLPAKVQKHLQEILKVFGGYSSYQLELMTHREAPWINARKGLAMDESCKNPISLTDMKKFYRKLST